MVKDCQKWKYMRGFTCYLTTILSTNINKASANSTVSTTLALPTTLKIIVNFSTFSNSSSVHNFNTFSNSSSVHNFNTFSNSNSVHNFNTISNPNIINS
ncbi:hypothetical protein PoB_007087300 [Plakobranchus ocellatus]|uniref:Uncharacterized protein n=1 Tax=Plakobranchus ocellatus TaxID=259542 RepID=A0AAV4DJE9_9GAST|nr:hypothetical protein PoB_007087300 [Plakobranchus ocellatus]